MSGEDPCGLGGHRRPHGDPDDARSQSLGTGKLSVKTKIWEQVWSSEQKGGHSVVGDWEIRDQQVLAHTSP